MRWWPHLCWPPGGCEARWGKASWGLSSASIQPGPRLVTLWQWHITVPSAAQCPVYTEIVSEACPEVSSNSQT